MMNRRLSIVVFLLSLLLCFESSAQSRVNYEAIDRMTKEEVMAEIRSTEAGLEKAEADYRRAKGKGGLDGELERQYHAEEVRIGKEILKALRAKLKEFETGDNRTDATIGGQSHYAGIQEGELDWMASNRTRRDLENSLESNRLIIDMDDIPDPEERHKEILQSEGINRLRARKKELDSNLVIVPVTISLTPEMIIDNHSLKESTSVDMGDVSTGKPFIKSSVTFNAASDSEDLKFRQVDNPSGIKIMRGSMGTIQGKGLFSLSGRQLVPLAGEEASAILLPYSSQLDGFVTEDDNIIVWEGDDYYTTDLASMSELPFLQEGNILFPGKQKTVYAAVLKGEESNLYLLDQKDDYCELCTIEGHIKKVVGYGDEMIYIMTSEDVFRYTKGELSLLYDGGFLLNDCCLYKGGVLLASDSFVFWIDGDYEDPILFEDGAECLFVDGERLFLVLNDHRIIVN